MPFVINSPNFQRQSSNQLRLPYSKETTSDWWRPEMFALPCKGSEINKICMTIHFCLSVK